MAEENKNLNNQNTNSINNTNSNNAPKANNENINQDQTPKYRAANSTMYDNSNTEYRGENTSSGEKTKEEIKAENDANNTEAVKVASEIASNSSHPVVAAIGNVVKRNKGLQQLGGKITTQANKLAPFAQSITNKLAKSEAAKKAVKAVAAKNGDAAEAGKDAAKNKVADAAKGAADSLASSSESSTGESSFSIYGLLTSPLFWILGGGTLVIFMVFFMIIFTVMNSNSSSGKEFYEQFPYANLKISEKVKVKIGSTEYEMTLDEATAAVLDHEDTGLTKSMEYLKARAIASRSRIVYEMNQSSYKKEGYILSGRVLGFKKASKNSKFQQAADATSGVILISGSASNPKFAAIEWDNIGHSSSCGGKETADSFIVCQKKVEVPFSFLKKHSYYTIDHWRKQVGLGRGMSQWGAYYLAMEKDYDAVKLLNYFYSKNTIVTFYEHTTPAENKAGSGECKALSSISSTSSSAKKPTTPLKTILKNKGTSVTSFNNGLLNAILDAGSGTRCAVVTAAIYSIKNLSSYGYRIPYSQPGYSVTHYGISGNWGQKACSSCKYDIKGLDCGTFVQWAFYNGGINLGFNQFRNKGKNVGYTDGKPGDVLYYRSTDGRNGHVMLILKYNSKKQGYYVAQAAGKTAGNTKINFVSTSFLKRNNYKVKDMSSYYCATSGCGKSKTKSNNQLKKAFN